MSEFLTHMAAITLGLLLALGIEQTAKYVHDQGKIAEARKALEEERQGNILTIGVATTNFRDAVAKTQRNLAIFLCIQSNKSRDCDKARDKI
ncbi:MAG: hypothetical protein HY255_10665, partial [Betaproteobacteria bacterium]|nr:hypothetical protein [Betaproteobacteria bacterium]